MKATIISMNIGTPEQVEWNGKTIQTSMRKKPVAGPLRVNQFDIDCNSFANATVHGSDDAVLYIYGLSSANEYAKLLGLAEYTPGATGETLTVDHFDEAEISVGDIFKIGEVLAQVTYPRIPCAKLNFRMQNARGQKAMEECGRSGVYFRILKPGQIHASDSVEIFERAKHRVSIRDLYVKLIARAPFTATELDHYALNGSFPVKMMSKWRSSLK